MFFLKFKQKKQMQFISSLRFCNLLRLLSNADAADEKSTRLSCGFDFPFLQTDQIKSGYAGFPLIADPSHVVCVYKQPAITIVSASSAVSFKTTLGNDI